MATLNGIRYKVNIVKASKEHIADGEMFNIIEKREHYILVTVYEKEPVHLPSVSYYPSKTLRFKLHLFGDNNIERVLLSTGLFDDNEKVKLAKENAVLKAENIKLKNEKHELFKAYMRLKLTLFSVSYGDL